MENLSLDQKVIAIDNVTYTNFIDYDELIHLPPDVATSYIIFLRRIGICSPKRLADLCSGADVTKLSGFLVKLGLALSVTPDDCQENLRSLQSWQEKILGVDPRKYRVSFKEVVAGATRSLGWASNFSKNAVVEKRVEDSLKSQKLQKDNPKEVKPVETMEKKLGKPIDKMVSSDVLTAARLCPIKPIRNYEDAKREEKYFENILVYFPDIGSPDVAKYLFNDTVDRFTINYQFQSTGLKRARGKSKRSLYERAAFVAWAGGDYETYIEEELQNNQAKGRQVQASRNQATDQPLAQVEPEPKKEEPEMMQNPEPKEEVAETPAEEPAANPVGRSIECVVLETTAKEYVPGRCKNSFATIELFGATGDIFRILALIADQHTVDISHVNID